jgi:hypothetical protein
MKESTMINWETTLAVTAERRKDDLAFAKEERLLRSIRKQSAPRSTRRYQRWLARFGARLVMWGGRLQARYASATHAPGDLRRECYADGGAYPCPELSR